MGTNMQDIQFLSTLSLRRATLLFWGEQYGGKISIHALLAESDGASNNPQHLPLAISIHALLAESDRHIFQVFAAAVIISIHALLAESDLRNCFLSVCLFISNKGTIFDTNLSILWRANIIILNVISVGCHLIIGYYWRPMMTPFRYMSE